jgi:hypothetical protein
MLIFVVEDGQHILGKGWERSRGELIHGIEPGRQRLIRQRWSLSEKNVCRKGGMERRAQQTNYGGAQNG